MTEKMSEKKEKGKKKEKYNTIICIKSNVGSFKWGFKTGNEIILRVLEVISEQRELVTFEGLELDDITKEQFERCCNRINNRFRKELGIEDSITTVKGRKDSINKETKYRLAAKVEITSEINPR